MSKIAIAALLLLGCTSSCPSPRHAELEPGPSCEACRECADTPPCPQRVVAEPEPPQPFEIQTLHEDLDGDGNVETISLTSDGHLRIGDAHAWDVRFYQEPSDDPQFRTAGLEVVDVRRDDGHREVMFWQDGEDSEDPPREYVFFGIHADELRVSMEPLESPARPEIRGDGTIRVRHERCAWPNRIQRTREELRMTRDGLIQPNGRSVDYVERECTFAACPFVYAGSTLVGEILRDLRSPGLEEEQSLEIPAEAVIDGTLTITVRELKPESTYLDEIHLVADGRTIRPRDCEGAAWCSTDGERLMLGLGDEQTFVFDVGPGASEIHLVARGYYVPHGSL